MPDPTGEILLYADADGVSRVQVRLHGGSVWMAAWIAKLDDFLRLSEREVLTHVGRVSAEAARDHAPAEFDRWRAARKALPEPVDADFDAAIEQTKAIEKHRPPRK